MLAATRGYHKIIQVFKSNPKTDFMVENKLKQTMLHMTLKAGYYNKIVVHGEQSGEGSIETLRCLLADDNLVIQQQMVSKNETL